MLATLHRTLTFFRRHPILWLPLVAVTLFLTALDRLRHLFQLQIIHWVMYSHDSVLGDKPSYRPNQANYNEAIFLGIPFEWGSVILGLFLHVMALIITAENIRNVLSDQPTKLTEASETTLRKLRPALLLSLKLFLIVQFTEPLIYTALLTFPAFQTFIATRPHLLLIGIPLHLSWQIFIGFFFAPAALALLTPATPSPLAIRRTRILGIASIFATAIITYLLALAHPSLNLRVQSPYLADITFPLIASLPMLLFFIAVSLTAMTDEPAPIAPSS